MVVSDGLMILRCVIYHGRRESSRVCFTLPSMFYASCLFIYRESIRPLLILRRSIKHVPADILMKLL